MKKTIILCAVVLLNFACVDSNKKQNEAKAKDSTSVETTPKEEMEKDEPKIHPISHASFVMEWGDKIWYNDPVGSVEAYAEYGNPDVVIISDIHGDHFSVETLQALEGEFSIITPQAVFDEMPDELQKKSVVLNNDDDLIWEAFEITAIPMYNVTEERLKYHTKGRGNGYVIEKDEFRLYISGDTENTDEMEALQDIDLALVCMNLPYTMTIQQAAEGVITFAPKKVIPYHYRGMKDGESHMYDTQLFERLVSMEAPEIKVKRLNWYPEN
ncbi:MBL fold metallo-hydrolase [Psychroflexus planctonicus]|uniref:Metal-dependent hydrolase n=1 Tax=Psychroflexus planctonicus TaxID=1526575 RepID=A0ABQ1SK06_9FLAO|nr:MBL fold metallo-hydrolase [Psychroflexus planctonicus]GGE43703.1 metal-dependent hydrolase [Psychroflexus planctonicus]